MPQQPEHLRNISIHAPREGCDDESVYVICESVFQSTHPVRGATRYSYTVEPSCTISIHAPREGCDHERNIYHEYANISIHAPREGCDT